LATAITLVPQAVKGEEVVVEETTTKDELDGVDLREDAQEINRIIIAHRTITATMMETVRHPPMTLNQHSVSSPSLNKDRASHLHVTMKRTMKSSSRMNVPTAVPTRNVS
jgi:hypothetical protein